MEQPKFQWSVFSVDRRQQWVVRSDSFEEFINSVRQLKDLLPITGSEFEDKPVEADLNGVSNGTHNGHKEESPLPQAPEAQSDVCPIHGKQMTQRMGRNGSWFDHRWQENGTWWQCNGKQVRSTTGVVK